MRNKYNTIIMLLYSRFMRKMSIQPITSYYKQIILVYISHIIYHVSLEKSQE